MLVGQEGRHLACDLDVHIMPVAAANTHPRELALLHPAPHPLLTPVSWLSCSRMPSSASATAPSAAATCRCRAVWCRFTSATACFAASTWARLALQQFMEHVRNDGKVVQRYVDSRTVLSSQLDPGPLGAGTTLQGRAKGQTARSGKVYHQWASPRMLCCGPTATHPSQHFPPNKSRPT